MWRQRPARASGSGRPAATPPLTPLQPPQAPRPRIAPGQHEAPSGGAEPGPSAPDRGPWPAAEQQVAAPRQQARAAAGRVPRGHPQRAAPPPRALLAAPEHCKHGHREARPRAARLAARAHRHLHRCGEGERGWGQVGE